MLTCHNNSRCLIQLPVFKASLNKVCILYSLFVESSASLCLVGVMLESFYEHYNLWDLAPLIRQRGVDWIVIAGVVFILHSLMPVYCPAHYYRQHHICSNVDPSVTQILAPAEESKDSQSVKRSCDSTKQGRKEDPRITAVFVVVCACSEECHGVSH